jgi:hypothetical protein
MPYCLVLIKSLPSYHALKRLFLRLNHMKMRNFFFHQLGICCLLIVITLSSSTLSAQSKSEEISHEDASLIADAYAMAFAACKFEYVKYKYDNELKNQAITNERAEMEKYYWSFEMRMTRKYQDDESQFDKFKRKVKSARKQLPTCIKYDAFFESLENSEIQTDGKSQ